MSEERGYSLFGCGTDYGWLFIILLIIILIIHWPLVQDAFCRS